MAIAAATRDPRFSPVAAVELPALQLEISLLSPRQNAKPSDISVGTHGICIERGTKRGILLPQVAVERQWDRRTFLEHTCMKAELPRDAWRDPNTVLQVFTAHVFGDHSIH